MKNKFAEPFRTLDDPRFVGCGLGDPAKKISCLGAIEPQNQGPGAAGIVDHLNGSMSCRSC
jgi:hypothetical protein